jgi:hypothetical protein
MLTIRHSEICAVTAGRLGKEYTAEKVDKTVTEYAKSVFDLISEKKPESSKEPTLVETPLIAMKINKRDSGVKRNPDGTETKIGTNYTVNIAPPNHLLEILNVGVEIVKTVMDEKKKEKQSA